MQFLNRTLLIYKRICKPEDIHFLVGKHSGVCYDYRAIIDQTDFTARQVQHKKRKLQEKTDEESPASADENGRGGGIKDTIGYAVTR